MRIHYFISLILLGFSFLITAEQKFVYNDLEIHYSAFSSAFLQPDVASAYDIKRSRYRGVVSVSMRKIDGADGETASGIVTGKAVNLSSQEKDLEFKEVRSGESVYYLATFPFTDQENLRFVLEITPMGQTKSQQVEFRQQFYTD